MRNIVLTIITILLLNLVLPTIVNNYALNNQQNELEDKTDLIMQNLEISVQDIQENKIIVGSQRGETSDLLPPVDVNPSVVEWGDILKNGISFSIKEDMFSNSLEKLIVKIIKYIIWAVNLTFTVWLGIFIWAKVTNK